jgi:predicted Zn finger-like uncharacterized protein
MEITCPNCRTVNECDVAAIRAGEILRCEQCGTIFTTEDVKRDIDKALDDFRRPFPRKF